MNYCEVCHKQLKKYCSVCCSECCGKYNSLKFHGRLPLNKKDSNEMKKVFTYDEVSVML